MLRAFQQQRRPVNGCDRAARLAPDETLIDEAVDETADVAAAQARGRFQFDDSIWWIDLGENPSESPDFCASQRRRP